MSLGELNLKGADHRNAVSLFVSVCRRRHEAELYRLDPEKYIREHTTQSGLPPETPISQTIFPPYNPPSERGEIYLFELEKADLVRVQQQKSDPASGYTGTTIVVEPTEEAYAEYLQTTDRVRNRANNE